MPPNSLGDLLSFARRLCAAQGDCDLSDGQLLEQFVNFHDDAAFSFLVHRHGPMVYAVCRRILEDAHSAEDAFQATFLVLVRRAARLGRKEPLGNWLFGVAQRIAKRARTQLATQRDHIRQVSGPAQVETLDELSWREIRGVLDEEIAALPAKYRSAIVLCHLESKSYERAAGELGCSKSTLAKRVERAREILRQRLSRRGVTLSAALVTTVLAEKACGAPVDALLMLKTVKIGTCIVTGNAVAGQVVSAKIVALAEVGMKAALLSKAKVGLLVLALGLAVGGAGLAGHGAWQKASKSVQTHETPKTVALGQQPPLATDVLGDPLPEGAIARLGTNRFRAGNDTTAVAFSPDGKTIASASDMYTLCLWDAATGRLIHQLRSNFFYSFAFSPDGKMLLTPDALIDVATGKLIRNFGYDRDVFWQSVAFSPDGKTLALGGHYLKGRTVTVLKDVSSDKEIRRWEGDHDIPDWNVNFWPPGLAFSPDGKTLASGTVDGKIWIWDVETGKKLHFLEGHQWAIRPVAFSPSNKVLATASADGLIQLWDRQTGRSLRRIKADNTNGVRALAFSPDGKVLASAGSEKSDNHHKAIVCLWDPETGQELRKWRVSTTWICSAMAFSPDGKVLVTAGGSEDGVIRRWDTRTGKEIDPPAGHTDSIVSLRVSQDGKTLMSRGNSAIWEWDLRTFQLRRHLFNLRVASNNDERWWNTYDVSADGKMVALVGFHQSKMDEIRIGDVATGKVIRTLTGQKGQTRAVSFSPDGKLLAAVEVGSTIVWEVNSGKRLQEIPQGYENGSQGNLSPLQFSPDGSLLALPWEKNRLRVWDIATGTERRRWDCDYNPSDVLFSPDGTTLSTNGHSDAGGWGLRLWKIATDRKQLPNGLEVPLEGSVQGRCFSPSGRILAVSSNGRKNADGNNVLADTDTIYLWDILSGKEIRHFDAAQTGVHALAILPDGGTLLTGGGDSTILLWDLTGRAKDASAKQPPLTAAQLDALWSDLAGDAPRAETALWTLARSPRETLPYLKKHLQPAAPVDPQELAKLIADLDSNTFALREKASQRLEELGDSAESGLRSVLEGSPSLELRRRVEQLLEKRFSAQIRPLRALDILEYIGTPEARQVLEALAHVTPPSHIADAAGAALGRLAKRTPR